MQVNHRCAIIGGGVIGLALAEELARRGRQVTLFEKQPASYRSTSWAAAGIIPPGNWAQAHDAYGQLCALSAERYPEWTARLAQVTGIDAEYNRCGGIQIARTAGEMAALVSTVRLWQADGLEVERIDGQQIGEFEPALKSLAERQPIRAAYWVPGEAQVRCSRLVDALRAACAASGVELCYDVEVRELVCEQQRVVGLLTTAGRRDIDQVCVTAGSWTGQLLAALPVPLDIQPWRGQIILLQGRPGCLRRVINEGPNYLVPRKDGRVVVGATVEEVGYNWQTTEALEELRQFAIDILPCLANAPVLDRWAGLRPRTNDGFPYLGRIPGLDNAFVAAGHFRSGIVLSPITATVMSDLMCDASPEVDLSSFRLDR